MEKFYHATLPLVWATIIWHLTTTPQIVVTENFWFQNLLMMVAHFTFFGLQAVFLQLALSSIFNIRHFLFRILITIFGTSLYGLLIELVQRNVPGRSADPLDWTLDTLGAIAFLAIIKKHSHLTSNIWNLSK